MVDQLSSFAAEVTRVAREVGTEGLLGGEADVRGLPGTGKSHRFGQFHGRESDRSGPQYRGSDHRRREGRPLAQDPVTVRGEILELKNTTIQWWISSARFASEVTRVAREVGTEGKLGGQAEVEASRVLGATLPRA